MSVSSGSNQPEPSARLLAPDEPQPFAVVNPVSESPVLLVCDHASHRIPKSLDGLGLDPFARRCHLAIDIGAGAVTRQVAAALKVTAVLARYSRLVVDCNRDLLDASAFLEFGDGIKVPGNCHLREGDRQRRAEEIYRPYHRAVDEQVKRLTRIGPRPVFISIHSFTPVLDGVSRAWEFGVLWDKDLKLKEIFLEELRGAGFKVGDNEPYSGKAPADYTIDHHAEGNDLPHLGLEIRQDLVSTPEGVDRISGLLVGIIEAIPRRIGYSGQRNTA